MLRLGLTGGIGAGKSTVARRLTELGAVAVDADQLAREVVEPGTEGLTAVVDAFGPGVLTTDGTLDRVALGAIVFGDDAARLRLNGILHPRIAELTRERLAGLPADAIVVHDVPLLVENRLGADYHLVLVVHAPVEERVRRLTADRGMAERDARARVGAQADDDARRAAGDVWLDNSGTVDALLAQVDRLWSARVIPFGANLAALRPAPRPLAVRLADPDPGWADAGRRLAARVARAAGEGAVRVDHVGSTAVPGLPARDVVDLQLVVRGLAVADEVCAGLEAAGFIRAEGRWWDRTADGGLEDERFLTAADPGRAANLHVRSEGGRFWREVLLLRDWLRAHDAERDAYAMLKAAAAGLAVQEYAARKRPWIDPSLHRATAWARATGWVPGPADA